MSVLALTPIDMATAMQGDKQDAVIFLWVSEPGPPRPLSAELQVSRSALPLDLLISVIPCPQNIAYWTAYALTWTVLPVHQNYTISGEFTVWARIKDSVVRNLKMIVGLLVVGVVGIVFLVGEAPHGRRSCTHRRQVAAAASRPHASRSCSPPQRRVGCSPWPSSASSSLPTTPLVSGPGFS